MKKSFVYTGLVLCAVCAFGVSMTGCYKDVILPPVTATQPPQFVSFSKDLQPIFSTNCALSGCHVAGSQMPYLTPDVSYQQLTGGFVNTIVPTKSTLYVEINGDMEVHIPSATDRQKIYDWIRNGAPNN
ncbi:MAG TPA: hypothetical protein VHE34_00065 [Puia sp.]|uniref:hypothetical protein n=1 Tax=Puia sp. TaxID=2045100 RepID=UPI002CFE89BF|nr:hypothetical protein [Puia sp.]HVU93579.1 hypothetical protein [Puia sp.]